MPPFPAGMASRVLNCPPGSVCKILLCASLTFLLIRDESDGFSECAGVSWLSVTFVLPFSSQTALLPFIPRCIPDQRDFNLFILGEELNRGELPGWESSSCSHPDKLCAAHWGQAFLSTPRPLCPGAAGVPKGLAPKLSLTGGLSSPGTSPPSLRDALPSSSPACIPPAVGRCPPTAPHPAAVPPTPWGKGAAGCPARGGGVWVPTHSPGLSQPQGGGGGGCHQVVPWVTEANIHPRGGVTGVGGPGGAMVWEGTMGSGDDTRPQFGSSLPLWLLCATPNMGSAPRGLCPPVQVALTPVLGPLHCGRGQPCSQCPQQPGLGLNWCVLGLPEKPCPIAVGSACAHSGVTQRACCTSKSAGSPCLSFP